MKQYLAKYNPLLARWDKFFTTVINIINTPKISIIIPTHNGKKYIAETVESVINQTWQNWELIIIDDGSEDNTCEIISSIGDPRIHIYHAGRIGIVGRLLNMGLEKASGDLIAFLDHDDLWAPTKLAKQVEAMQTYPAAGFCVTGGYNFRRINEPLEYFYKQREGIRYDDLLNACFKSEVAGFTQALMIRRECLIVAGHFTESIAADLVFIISLAMRFKGIILYEPLFFRRLHNNNLSAVNWEKLHLEGLEMIRSYKGSLPPDVFKDALFRSHINLGEKYLKRGKKGKAVQQFFNAWSNKPVNLIPLRKIAKTILYFLKGK